MIAEQLKRSILQAAIQGKISKQLTEDGNAQQLLKEIQKEKARLIKEGKIKKEKPLPEITADEIPFDIPENWYWVRLESITSLLGDGIHGTPNYTTNGEYKFINGNNLNDGKIEIKSETKAVNEKEYLRYKKSLDETTVLVSINGTIGNVAFYNQEKILLGKSACYFNLLGNISKYYVKLLLNSDYFIKYAFDKATGSTIKNVSLQAIRNFPVPLPPLIEQNRIVAHSDDFLPEIDKLKNDDSVLDDLQKAFSKKMKDSILQYAVQGKVTEQLKSDGDARDLLTEIQKEKARLIKEGKIKKEKPLPEITADEIPFDIPENWSWTRLGNVILQNTGGGTPSKSNPAYWNGGIAWASVKDLNCKFLCSTQDHISEAGLNNSSSNLIPKGNLIVCTRMGLGKIVYNNIDVAINQDLRALFLSEKINKWYIYYFYLTLNISGKGATVKGISVEDLSNALLPVPPFTEQSRIVERLESLLLKIDELKMENPIKFNSLLKKKEADKNTIVEGSAIGLR
jgi:type I restriction enzyme, S subunit